MFKKLNIWKNAWNLLLRYVMICVFVFMCVILIATNSKVLGPIFGVFYFIALIYYFGFTMKAEGELDVNRVSNGSMPRFRWKGAVCALVVAIPLMIINIIPNFFPNPVPEEYQAYFTGEATQLSETDNFNKSLKELSGKDGYVSEITFATDQTILKIVYTTSGGERVICDGTVSDQNKIYALSTGQTDASGNPVLVYYTQDAELTDEQMAAFEECKNAVDDISSVMGSYPHWQIALSTVKAVCVIALQYFCALIAGPSNPVLSTVVYCVCMLILCVSAQIGYEMGYRNISILRKKKPVNDPKAGDSVTIQRAHRPVRGE